MPLAALDADRVANLGLLLLAGLAVMAIVTAVLIRAVVAKVLVVAAVLGLGALVWSQRTTLTDCTALIKAQAVGPGVTSSPCEFLGLKVDVTVP